jgi:hypothetical protein
VGLRGDLKLPRNPLCYKGIRSERDSNPRYRLTRYTAFPGLGMGVQGGAPAGTAYSDFSSRGHHGAGEGTRVGTPLGLELRISGRPLSATATSGDKTLACARDSSRGRAVTPVNLGLPGAMSIAQKEGEKPCGLRHGRARRFLGGQHRRVRRPGDHEPASHRVDARSGGSAGTRRNGVQLSVSPAISSPLV